MAKILIVEDDVNLANTVADWLRYEFHNVEVAHNGRDGFELITGFSFDAAVLDWMLPELTGVEICKRVRDAGNNVPILMLTSNNTVPEKVKALDAGADDYLTKPCHVDELCARVRVLLRRNGNLLKNNIELGDLILNQQLFMVTKGGVEITLLPKEFALLELLMRNPGRVYSQDELLERIWGTGTESGGDAVRSCVKRLRKKLSPDNAEEVVETVHSVGYRVKRP